MATIQGITRDKQGNILPEVSVELKNERFQTQYSTVSDEQGRFALTAPDAVYPFLIAVRDYAVGYLEYWAHNVPALEPLDLDIEIDTLELYGINAFTVKGPGRALSIYFRPMSLGKFLAQEQDIAPDFDADGITVRIDGQESEVLVVNRVQEFAGEGTLLTAYLIQAALPEDGEDWSQVDLRVRDHEGHTGAATLFREAAAGR